MEVAMNKIQYRFDNERITNHGGFEIVNRFIDSSLNLLSLIEKHLSIKKRKSIYSIAHLTYAMINSNILYPFRINQLDYIRNDDFLKEKFDFENHPDSDTYRRHLHKFSRGNLTDLKRLIRDLFNRGRIKSTLSKLRRITIDIDSSLIEAYGDQEGVGYSYLSSKTGNKYYNVLFAFIFELDLLVNLLLRRGNSYTSKSAVHFLRQVLLIIPSEFHHKIVVRADSGFFNERILAFLEAHHIQYIIKAKSYGSFDELIRRINHRRFAPKNSNIQFARDSFKLHNWEKERSFLIIKKKIIVKNSKELENKSQFELPFKLSNYYYSYTFIVVSDSELTNRQLFSYYSQRGASENYIKEYKTGFGGSDIATDRLVANYANMLLKAISYTVFSLFKRFVLENEFKNKQIQTLRYFIIYIPGKLVKRGSKHYLSLIKNYRYATEFMKWEQKLVPL